jgi:hypothetical protein
MVIVPKEGAITENDNIEKIKQAASELKERAEAVTGSINKNKMHGSKVAFLGLIFILLGSVILFNQLFPAVAISGKFWWPAFLIFIGFYLVFKKSR